MKSTSLKGKASVNEAIKEQADSFPLIGEGAIINGRYKILF